MTMSWAPLRHTGQQVRRAAAACARLAGRIKVRSPQPLRWLLDRPDRLVILAWLIGCLIVGHARAALAEDIITGPDLAHGQAKTLFETYGFVDYGLTVKPDENASGTLDVAAVVWHIIGVINMILLWLCLGILEGALTLLEWLLNLTIYADSESQIDQAVTMVASQVFWPLISATVAIGAFMSYARWKAEGRGFASDLGWVVAAAVLGMAFAAGPSTVMSTVDSARQGMATGIIAGSSKFVSDYGSPTGFPTPPIGGSTQEAGTRKLVDGMWSSYGATSWCFAHFRSLEVCRAAGSHALADDDIWRGWMDVLDQQGTVPEFGPYQDYIRGQDIGRLGILLLLAALIVPLALLLARLVIAGLTAAVGLLLMLVITLVFLVGWPIPGWPRTAGTRTLVYLAGLELQALFITVATSGVMVTSTVITNLAGKYGFFVVTLLNVALLSAASRLRTWLDGLIGVEGARSMGIVSYMVMRSAVRTVAKVAVGAATGGVGLAAGIGHAVGRAGLQTASGGLPASVFKPGRGPMRMTRMSGVDSGPARKNGAGPPTTRLGGARPQGQISGGPQRNVPTTRRTPRYFDPLQAIEGGAPPRAPSSGHQTKPGTGPVGHGTTFDAKQRYAAHGRAWEASPGGHDTTRQSHTGATLTDTFVVTGSPHLSPPDASLPPPSRTRRGVVQITDAKPPRKTGRSS